ncbi:MAG: 6-carboxytetrahydropterin synthase [Candidatus Pacearchaeota archaeon]|jgi:6-pyruvoyltetrahydropterin/6-carboxytetrahydropterin synthase
MYTLKLKHHFDAAHKLEDYAGPCSNLHGHRWDILVEIEKDSLKNDMVIDFKRIKEIINQFDHVTILQDRDENNKLITVMNECGLLMNLTPFNPTAENLALHLKNLIWKELGNNAFDNVKVTLWESPEASITV